MLDIKKIARLKASTEVKDFMAANGGNHVSLYSGWKKNSAMRENLDLLEQQMAVAIRAQNEGVARRIRGRIRAVEDLIENAELSRLFGRNEKTNSELTCLE
jgi:hypothetical protein